MTEIAYCPFKYPASLGSGNLGTLPLALRYMVFQLGIVFSCLFALQSDECYFQVLTLNIRYALSLILSPLAGE